MEPTHPSGCRTWAGPAGEGASSMAGVYWEGKKYLVQRSKTIFLILSAMFSASI